MKDLKKIEGVRHIDDVATPLEIVDAITDLLNEKIVPKINEVVKHLNTKEKENSIKIIEKPSGYMMSASDGDDDFVREKEFNIENDYGDSFSKALAAYEICRKVLEYFDLKGCDAEQYRCQVIVSKYDKAEDEYLEIDPAAEELGCRMEESK